MFKGFSHVKGKMSLYLIHLVVSCNVLVQGPQQDHGNHARQEEDND